MREALRRDADAIFVIDCAPEGHQPPVSTRIFGGVQHPVCIVIAAKDGSGDRQTPARVLFRELPLGRREDKFAALAALSLDDDGWQEAGKGWRASFLPEGREAWAHYPALEELFVYNGSGVMPGRTWPIAPDKESLQKRWTHLQNMKDPDEQAAWFRPHLRNGQPGDKHIDKLVKEGLGEHEWRVKSVRKDKGPVISPVRYAFRSFDRQWIIPDKRLLNQPNPTLWQWHSDVQVYVTASHDRTPDNGPALTMTSFYPDLHHYHGRGGRAFPLLSTPVSGSTNIAPSLLAAVEENLGIPVAAEDLFAYIAAIAAHPGYTARFAADLRQPGLRIPLTADAALFEDAVLLGEEVVWLHCFGERFADPAKGRPKGAPRAEGGPVLPKEGAIPLDPGRWPDQMHYDRSSRRLHVGEGFIDNVAPAVWDYDVSGMKVLTQWFSYRKKDRSRPLIGDKTPPSPLNDITPGHWMPEYTRDLMDILHVLTRLIALEDRQADLLARIVESPQLDRAILGLAEDEAVNPPA